MFVLCLRVEPSDPGRWEVSFSQHPISETHDANRCDRERSVLVHLVEDQGVCQSCGDAGLVLHEDRTDRRGPVLCPHCTTLHAQRFMYEVRREMESGGSGGFAA